MHPRRHVPLVPQLLLALACLSPPAMASAHGFTLLGPVAMAGDRLPQAQVADAFGCHGGNRSPALRWLRVPPGARSFAVTAFDMDAPTGSGWWHWIAYDLPAGTTRLPAGAGAADGAGLPAGARQARNDFGAPGYGGACPPAGDAPHRYVFTVHALDVDALEIPADATPAMVRFLIHRHAIAQASVTARYAR
ncbi:YbhB/YbcL family Raf kinase inhibitor-like protein [Thermomonas sp.]|uniref:YbhB/YbcL family Raf kinase inhibitor-like protein n=1 Tax=Thermomonas sp. TaxID=1971895 RepID=UPI0035AF5D11